MHNVATARGRNDVVVHQVVLVLLKQLQSRQHVRATSDFLQGAVLQHIHFIGCLPKYKFHDNKKFSSVDEHLLQQMINRARQQWERWECLLTGNPKRNVMTCTSKCFFNPGWQNGKGELDV